MFTEERQNAIEKCLREKGKVRVKELSEMFQVTEDCIRKDLKILENAGRLKRTYGGAILSQEYPLERNVVDRRMYNLDKKKVIAAKAFKLIKNTKRSSGCFHYKYRAGKAYRFVGYACCGCQQYDRYPADPRCESVHHGHRHRGNYVPFGERIYGSCGH